MWIAISLIIGLIFPAALVLQFGYPVPSSMLGHPTGSILIGAFLIVALTDMLTQSFVVRRVRTQRRPYAGDLALSIGMVLHALAVTPAILSALLPFIANGRVDSIELLTRRSPWGIDWINIIIFVAISLVAHQRANRLTREFHDAPTHDL